MSGEKRRCRDLGGAEVLTENWAGGKARELREMLRRKTPVRVLGDNAIEE